VDVDRRNRFGLVRYRQHLADERFMVTDVVAVLIDGRDLVDILGESAELDAAGKSWSAGLPYDVVAPPSRHWLGEPMPGYSGSEGVAVLDAGCGLWECCGPGASIEFADTTVTWRIRGLDAFHFERAQYEREIAGLTHLSPVDGPAA
jgi:hypothetical protein